jgi:hypothetical protein
MLEREQRALAVCPALWTAGLSQRLTLIQTGKKKKMKHQF